MLPPSHSRREPASLTRSDVTASLRRGADREPLLPPLQRVLVAGLDPQCPPLPAKQPYQPAKVSEAGVGPGGEKRRCVPVVVITSRDGRMPERVVNHLCTVTAQYPCAPERRYEVVCEGGDHAVTGRCAVVPGRTPEPAEPSA